MIGGELAISDAGFEDELRLKAIARDSRGRVIAIGNHYLRWRTDQRGLTFDAQISFDTNVQDATEVDLWAESARVSRSERRTLTLGSPRSVGKILFVEEFARPGGEPTHLVYHLDYDRWMLAKSCSNHALAECLRHETLRSPGFPTHFIDLHTTATADHKALLLIAFNVEDMFTNILIGENGHRPAFDTLANLLGVSRYCARTLVGRLHAPPP